MNLDSLIPTTGEWLRGTGPESDVVISTRIRLARNLASFPFTNRATALQKAEIEALLRDRITRLDVPQPLQYLNVAGLPPLDRQFLVERQIISRELSSADGPRGVAFDEREAVSIMVNEEDQLRLQVMRSGLALEDAWHEIDHVDDLIEARISYAFHEQFGYLTACPTNVGTGMRVSVMLHLPALVITQPAAAIERRRILVVDDEESIQQLLTGVLEMDGHDVHVANNGREALDRVGRERFDLIITDIKMPVMGGPDLYRRLSDDANPLARRVIFITGDTVAPETRKFLQGVDNAVLLTDRAFAGSDTWSTAYALSKAIEYLGADVILCGKQAIDGDTAQVGPEIAEFLDILHALTPASRAPASFISAKSLSVFSASSGSRRERA